MVDFDSLQNDPVPAPSPQTPPNTNPTNGVPFDSLQDDAEKYGSAGEIAKTAVEQALSGATLGASKVLETQGIPSLGIPAITTPGAVAGREAANPITSFVAGSLGTGAAIAATEGLTGIGAALKAAPAAARIAASGLTGGVLGGANQVTDDWSQNKPLDAQKIVASAGLGTLIGTTGGIVGEAIASKLKPKPLAEVPGAVADQAESAANSALESAAPPMEAPKEYTGVKPTSFSEIQEQTQKAIKNGNGISLPEQNELASAISRTPLENPVNPAQFDSLTNTETRDIYRAAKENPGEASQILNNYEGLQKAELNSKTDQTIQSISPGLEPTSDAYQGGKTAIQYFTGEYQNEKQSLAPFLQELRNTPLQGYILPDAIDRMSQAVPGIANMFEIAPGESLADGVTIRPYKTAWGIDKATYNAVKEATDSLSGEKNNLETLWNVRKGLDQHVDVLTQGQAPREIRALKAALMDQMQDSTGNPEIRDAFKRYAINEQQRQVIEKSFGASVGSPEFGQISKVKPEMIGDKIFGNTATVQAAKQILPPEQFQHILSNWINEAKAAATDKGSFSSNKFASFLRRNQDALNIAFSDNPDQFQRLKDLTTISRILPDAASINPSGTAKTLSRMILGNDINLHDLTWTGLLASIPKKIGEQISNRIKLNQLNQRLSGQALQNSQITALQNHIENISGKIDLGIKGIFMGGASQTRKNNGRQ